MSPRAEPDRHDSYYRTRFEPSPARDRIWPVICRYLERYHALDGAVLDLGAGYCSFVNHVRAAERHAVDVYPDFTRFAVAGVETHVGPCWDLEAFRDGHFDVVFASNLLEHLTREEVALTLARARRVLKPSGRLILVQPNYRYCAAEYFDDYTHQLVFSHVSLADLLASSGFRVEAVEARFLPLTFKSRLPQWAWLAALYLRLPVRPLAKQMLLVASRSDEPGPGAR